MRKIAVILVFLGACTASPAPAPAPARDLPPAVISYAPYEFVAGNGTKIPAELGKFQVSENRNDPNARLITLSFVRFASTSPNPGPPIVYLAGGPGGSGIQTARGPRFSLFMALREVADVIAFDQRGTGMSRTMSPCRPENNSGPEEPLTRETIVPFYRVEIARCFDKWEADGIDIDGYTTLQNAHDVDDLRRALGVEKINLWGISYGSHLGLTVLKYHPKSVDRAVLAGIEGLDETVKLPFENDAYFGRVQAIIDADPVAKAAYPDFPALMRRVHARLNATPAQATFIPPGKKEQVTVTFDGFAVQMLASGSIADPLGVRRLPLLYAALDAGDYTQTGRLLYSQFLSQPSSFSGMPEAMDLASGVSPARMALLEEQFVTSILGDTLNFPMPQVAGIRPSIDLGEAFRAPFKSSVPTLFISGTLDGRTYPAEAAKTAAGFANGSRLIVENGGHNIYEADPRIAAAVLAWFKGEGAPSTIRFDPPKIAVP